MTVAVPNTLLFDYAGDGVTTSFAYTNFVHEAADLVVVLEDANGVQTVQEINTQYTVSGVGTANVSANFLDAPASGEKVYLYRDTARKQTVDLEDSARNPANTTETQLDRIVRITQDLGYESSRSLKRPVGAVPFIGGRWLKTDADGNIVDGGDESDLSNAASNAAAAQQAAEDAADAQAAAEAAAAGVNLPSLVPDTFLKAKTDGTGYEPLTANETLDALGGQTAGKALFATATGDAAAALVQVTPDTARQAGGAPVTTFPRTLVEVLNNEFPSIYEFMSEAVRADCRTGLQSGTVSTPFYRAVDKYNPGGSNIPGGVKIRIPRGRYPVNVGIPLQDSVEWDGENLEGTRIVALGNNKIFESLGTSANQVGRAAIRNMTLVGDGTSHLSGYGVHLKWMHNPKLENIQFQALRWCIVQEYTVNAFLRNLTSNGTAGSIRGYLWKRAIDSINFAGFDNTTTMSDCYFMGGIIAMVIHGSNGIQMGGNVAMLQGGVRMGAISETLPDGTPFTPGADNDPIHFEHWDGLRLDTITNDRAIRIVKGSMPAIHDIHIRNLWAGNITGSNSSIFDFNGVTDFGISAPMVDVTGNTPIVLANCSRGVISGGTFANYGGANNQNAALLQSCQGVGIVNNDFQVHNSATGANGVRAESSSRIRVVGNGFDFRNVTPSASQARRAVLVDTTGSVVCDNTTNDLASIPCVESGTSDRNRIHDNPSTAAPTLVGAASLGHHNDTATT